LAASATNSVEPSRRGSTGDGADLEEASMLMPPSTTTHPSARPAHQKPPPPAPCLYNRRSCRPTKAPLTPSISDARADDTESAQRIAAAHPLVARRRPLRFLRTARRRVCTTEKWVEEKGDAASGKLTKPHDQSTSKRNPTTNLSKETSQKNKMCIVLLKLRLLLVTGIYRHPSLSNFFIPAGVQKNYSDSHFYMPVTSILH
jgi:hypothetical protein